MFPRNMFAEIGGDPFFNMHREQMRRMNEMMANPFGMTPMIPAIVGPTGGIDGTTREQQRDYARRAERHRSVQPYTPYRTNNMNLFGGGMFGGGMFGGGMFGGSLLGGGMFGGGLFGGGMFDPMNQMMQTMQQVGQSSQDPNCQFYSQSSVMSYQNDGTGQPKVYQATSSTKQAPGGVRETKKTVRDSESGVEKIAVGRHIGERSHVVSKSRNVRTGDAEENQDFVNLEEDEAESFNGEFMERVRPYNGAGARNSAIAPSRQRTPPMRAITSGASASRRSPDDANHVTHSPSYPDYRERD